MAIYQHFITNNTKNKYKRIITKIKLTLIFYDFFFRMDFTAIKEIEALLK